VSRAYDRTRGVSHIHCHKGRRHVSLAWACHWPSAVRSAALKQGWMPSATVLISPLPPQTQPFSISRRPSFLFLSITRTVCLHSTLWPRTLLTSSQRNSVISRPNKYNSTVYNPLVRPLKPTRSAQTHTPKCLPPQTPSPRPLALSSSLRVASAAASAQTTAVAAAFLALSCKCDSKNIKYGGI
jgi:hypothetical protein